MNCFQIIKTVLDEAYAEIQGSDEEKDKLISEALEKLSADYSNLLNGAVIDYANPDTRFAYIYKYVTSHANLVFKITLNNKDLGLLFDRDKITVACIGGGPGSDFLGILKYLIVNDKKPVTRFKLCDREKTWAESWSDVDDKVDAEFRISTSYLSIDVTNPEDWKSHAKYYQSDLFTMIYFISEVHAHKKLANEYFNELFSRAKSGALFLFVDNNNQEFYSWFDDLALENNVEIIKREETFMTIPFEEEKSDLGVYFEKFSSPKLKANVAWRIGRKL